MLIKRLGVSRIKCNHEYTSADYTSLFIFLFENGLNIYNLYMQWRSFREKKKKAILFFFLWFVHGRLHALLSLYQWRSSVSWLENTLCQTVLNTHTRTEITFCSMSEGSWFIFLRNASFFRYGSFQVHLQTFRCARPTRKLYCSFLFCEVVKHLLVVFFLCVSYFWLSLFFCYHGFKWKK